MGVYPRKDSPYWWITITRPGQRPLVENTRIPRAGATTEQTRRLRRDAEEAYLARAAQLARANYDLPVDKPRITLAEYLPWYEAHRTARKRGADQERFRLALLGRELGTKGLHEIDAGVADAYRTTRLQAGRRPATVNREMNVLRAVLTSAVPKYLAVSPLAKFKKLAEGNYEGRPITAEQETQLLAALKPADMAMYLMGLDTLMRLSDVLDFEWTRVRDGYGVIVDPKNGVLTTVPFSTRLQEALDDLPRTGRYLFPVRRRGTENERRSRVRKMLEWACKKAGIPYGRYTGITWHTATRHTGATRLSEAGYNTLVIQQVGGWKSAAMVRRYSHLDTVKADAVEAIGRSGGVVPDRKVVSFSEGIRSAADHPRSRKMAK
jgi:site-specific recombinase XerD